VCVLVCVCVCVRARVCVCVCVAGLRFASRTVGASLILWLLVVCAEYDEEQPQLTGDRADRPTVSATPAATVGAVNGACAEEVGGRRSRGGRAETAALRGTLSDATAAASWRSACLQWLRAGLLLGCVTIRVAVISWHTLTPS
jgi:hypothetical protein